MENRQDLFRAKKSEKAFMIGFIMVLTLVWLLPMYSVLTNSLKINGLGNYLYVLTNPVQGVPFSFYFLNSLVCAVGSSGLCVLISTLAGFGFSKISFRGKKVIYNTVLMCLAVSGPIVLVPLFFTLKSLGLYNSYLAVILPEVTMTLPFGVLMLRNYYDGLPDTLMESAYLDGASMWQVFLHVYFPLGKPALINLAVLQIMWSFQDFLLPLMFLNSPKLFTASVAISAFKGVYGTTGKNLAYYNAALVLIAVPAIIIFVIMQKYIINGITTGSIKD